MRWNRAAQVRRLPLAIAVLLAVGYGGTKPLAGQFPQLPGAVRGLVDRIPDLGRFTGQGPVLTTSLQDVVGRRGPLPGGLGDGSFAALTSLPLGSNGEVQLRPGRFAMTVESFCLHPGGRASAHAEGFFLAPLKGPGAPIISGVLRSASRFPELNQETIQLLLWGLIARTPVSSMPREVQAAAALLISPQDLIKVNGGALGLVPQELLDLAQERLPAGVREAFEAESRIRQMVADGVSTYEEFESVAVPDADDARENSDGSGDDEWVLHPNGFYIRFSPIGYQQVRVEFVVPRRPGAAVFNQPPDRFRILPAAWYPAAGVQAGDVEQTLDLVDIVAIPGDSGGQRLGLSTRLVPGADPIPIPPAGPPMTRNDPPDDLGPQPPIAPLDSTPGDNPAPAPTPPTPSDEASIGRGETKVQVPASGELSQDVVIKFNALSGKDPSAATHYYCDVMFWLDVGTGRVPTAQPPTGYEWTRVQPGFVNLVAGPLRPAP